VEFHEKLREAFRLLALSEPERCVLIDANAPSATVGERIWKVISERLDPATAPVAIGDVAS
jgi:dTMP kinase